jgi:hypothetical protein
VGLSLGSGLVDMGVGPDSTKYHTAGDSACLTTLVVCVSTHVLAALLEEDAVELASDSESEMLCGLVAR